MFSFSWSKHKSEKTIEKSRVAIVKVTIKSTQTEYIKALFV